MNEIKLPELGAGIEKAVVACLHCKIGDKIQEGDDMVEVVTDKAAFNIEATVTGTVKEILVKDGQEVKIGEILAIINHDLP